MRFLPILIAAVLALALTAPAQADSGWRECGKTSTGWRMVAGNSETSCPFVKAVYKSIKHRQDSAGEIAVGATFHVKAKSPTTGKTYRMTCLTDQAKSGYEVLCNGSTGATANYFHR